ncbi:MAG: MBL fold metallo-hydrolase [bacterium]|nr:MBL fold metallo-hydrolase [bacterium]
MMIEYNGHACFTIKTSLGTIVTDPFGEDIPYPVKEFTADIVTVSHDHFDHNAVKRVKGDPYVVKDVGEYTYRGIKINGIKAAHDKNKGSQRGQIVIFTIEAEGLKLCHLGDLGEILNEDQLKKIGEIDTLFIPVGGFYTIEPEDAKIIVKTINPKVVIPMHYKTNYVKEWKIKPVDEFLKDIPYPIKRLDNNKVEIVKETLPKSTEVYVLKV